MATIPQPTEKTDRWVDEEGRVHRWHSQTWTRVLEDAQLAREWGWVYHERQTHRIEQHAQGMAEEQIKEQQVAVKQGVRTLRVKWTTSLKQIFFGPPGSGAEPPEGRTTVDEHWENEHDFGETTWIPHVAPSPAPLPTVIPVSTPSTGLTPTPVPLYRNDHSERRVGPSSPSRRRSEGVDLASDDDESDTTIVGYSASSGGETDVEYEELKRQLRKVEEARRNKRKKRSAQASRSRASQQGQSQNGGDSSSRKKY